MTRCLCVFSRVLGWKVFGRYVDEQLSKRTASIAFEYLDYGPSAFRLGVPWYAQLSDTAAARHRLARLAAADGIDPRQFDAFIFQGHDLIVPFRRVLTGFVGVIADATPAIALRRRSMQSGLRGFLRRLFKAMQNRLLYAAVFRRVSSFLVLSSAVRRSLVEDYGVDESRIYVVGPPVYDRIEARPDRPRNVRPEILFVGNDFERKGGPFLLHLYERYFRDRADLCIVSNSVSRDRLGPGVRLYSNISNDDVLDLMLSSHVFVFPSYHDELGLVLAEAACAGLPLVARASGGQSEYVRHQENGFLLAPVADEFAWKNAIEDIIDDPVTWNRFSRRSRELGRELCTQSRFDRQFAGFIAGLTGESRA